MKSAVKILLQIGEREAAVLDSQWLGNAVMTPGVVPA